MGKGTGDLYIKGICGIIFTEIFVRDARFYDASSSANVSKYSKTGNGSLSYDSTNQCYLLNNGSTNWKWTSWIMSNVDFSNTLTVKAKIRLLTNYNCQVTLGLQGTNKGILGKCTIASSVGVYAMAIVEQALATDSTDVQTESLSSSEMQTNTWYDIEIIYNGTSITYKLYNGDTLVKTASGTSSVLTSSNNKLVFALGMYGNSQANIKDITVL